jgi:hypothetical protein
MTATEPSRPSRLRERVAAVDVAREAHRTGEAATAAVRVVPLWARPLSGAGR